MKTIIENKHVGDYIDPSTNEIKGNLVFVYRYKTFLGVRITKKVLVKKIKKWL